MLYLISLGLELKDISVKAVEAIKDCDKLYLESYTSIGGGVKDIETLIGKKVQKVDRKFIEEGLDKILEEAKKENIGILVYGDVLTATTHFNFIIYGKEKGIKVKVVHSSSVLIAIAETGLFPYKFGKIASIPFENKRVNVPFEVIENNLKIGMHTLVLLDLDPKNNKYLSINDALHYLLDKGLDKNKEVVACSNLGMEKQRIKVGKINDLVKIEFKEHPQCLVVLSDDLHFMEEEALKLWK